MTKRRIYEAATAAASAALLAWLLALSLLMWQHVTEGPWPCP